MRTLLLRYISFVSVFYFALCSCCFNVYSASQEQNINVSTEPVTLCPINSCNQMQSNFGSMQSAKLLSNVITAYGNILLLLLSVLFYATRHLWKTEITWRIIFSYSALFTESAHWVDSVIESRCPYACMYVCMYVCPL